LLRVEIPLKQQITLKIIHIIASLIALGAAGVSLSAAAQTSQPEISWKTQCRAADRQSPLQCTMAQSLFVTQSGQQIAKISIETRTGEGATNRFVLQLPLGLSLKAGVTLVIDKKPSLTFDIQTCEATGCFVSGPLSDSLLDGMKKGKELKIILRNLKRDKIELPISLDGFSATFDAVK